MASFNRVTLLGNCGRDPEVRYLPSGQAVANVSIATSSKWKDRNSGELMEETQWHRLTFYDKLAEIAGEYLKKGNPVLVEGRLKYGEYTDKDGIKRYSTDIIVTSMQLLGSRSDGDDHGHGQSQRRPASQGQRGEKHQRDQDQYDDRTQQQPRRNEYAEQRGRPQPRTQPQRPAQPPGGASGFDDMDSDIPF